MRMAMFYVQSVDMLLCLNGPVLSMSSSVTVHVEARLRDVLE